MEHDWIIPDWPAPKNVQAVVTTRCGGSSRVPYDNFNLSTTVGDNEDDVKHNRLVLQQTLSLPNYPYWLTQVHGSDVVRVNANSKQAVLEADGSITSAMNVVCAVLTADCLPVLLCDVAGRQVAALHAGWRGLHAGIIESGLHNMEAGNGSIMAWLGPAIGPKCFEIGDEVRELFLAKDMQYQCAFRPLAAGKWLADIYSLARITLQAEGVTQIYGGGYCSYTDNKRFFSYRRDRTTGRMASLIWMNYL